MSKKTGKKNLDEAKKTILEHMIRTNRPYNAKTLFENIHGKEIGIGQKAVENILDALVSEGYLVQKVNNKKKLYWPEQSQFPSLSNEELQAIDQQMQVLTAQNKQVAQERQVLQQENVNLKATPTNDELDKEIANITAENAKLRANLEDLRANHKPITPQQKEKVKKRYDLSRDAWRKRKKICNDIRGTLEENMGTKKFKKIADDIGLETDEQHNASLTENKTSALEKQGNK